MLECFELCTVACAVDVPAANKYYRVCSVFLQHKYTQRCSNLVLEIYLLATYCTGNDVNMIAASLNSIVWLGGSLIPRHHPDFCRLQYGKVGFFVCAQGEPGNASLAGLSGNQSESTHNCTFNQSGVPSLVHHSN